MAGMGMAMSGQPAAQRELNVSLRHEGGVRDDTVFSLDVTLTAAPGFTILFGPSGAGKTTLLDCIAGLTTPDAGRIAIGTTMLFDSQSQVNIPPHRRGLGYLTQSLALFPHMSVRQNVEYGLAGLEATERKQRSDEVLESFRIAALAGRRPREISGGERQRTALARALVTRPGVLLLDEPLTALDAATKGRIVDDLRAWNKQNEIPILYVTHQREEVFALGENVIVLDGGRIIAEGPPHEALHRPTSETVAQLAGFENIFDGAIVAQHPELGTMTCRIAKSELELEVPLARVDVSQSVRVGIRAGDILLAAALPQGLSARNVLAGTLTFLGQRDAKAIARVNCGVDFEVHLTLAACQALQLAAGMKIWLVAKTYSCHVLQSSG